MKRNYYSSLCSHYVHNTFYECFAGAWETQVIDKGNFLMSALHREMTNVYIQRYCSHGNHNSASLCKCTYIKEYAYARKMRYGFFGEHSIDFSDKCQPLFCISISCAFFISLYLLNSTLHASIMKGCFVVFSHRR